MKTFKTSEAAAVLNVSTNTLRVWERKFGFPRPFRSPGNQRFYSQVEIMALSEALGRGLTISSAISVARDTHGGDSPALVNALSSCSSDRADRVMESSLALRSVEESLEEVMLPALDRICERTGTESAVWAFASAWSEEWLLRTRRLAARTSVSSAVLIGDASGRLLDPVYVYAQALALCCARSGLDVLVLPTRASRHVREVVTTFQPRVAVIAGAGDDDEQVARWAYQVSSSSNRLQLRLYHRRPRCGTARNTASLLPASPVKAVDELSRIAGTDSYHAQERSASARP